jgi:hypothetical protein
MSPRLPQLAFCCRGSEPTLHTEARSPPSGHTALRNEAFSARHRIGRGAPLRRASSARRKKEAAQACRSACDELIDEGAIHHRRIVLLCHKFRYLFRAAQHGQRASIVARAATNLRRIVAIEFGTWRSGRNGGSSGLVSFA